MPTSTTKKPPADRNRATRTEFDSLRPKDWDSALLEPANFLLATRDTGYASTTMAIAELIDNSIQAGARTIHVSVVHSGDRLTPVEMSVVDDGSGMNASELGKCLRFGGSSRFDDRSSLGRFGMGLPNGTLSRARRVEVYSWIGQTCRHVALDIDDVIDNRQFCSPQVTSVERPELALATHSGTAVLLKRCDRVEYRRPSTVANKLSNDLGRIYRRLISKGVRITINDKDVVPVDPLLLMAEASQCGATRFGDVLRYRLTCGERSGTVEVEFSELPVDRWHQLSPEAKREMTITGGASVSVVRADREIDSGWFFMGGKRRQNYDDWWRCEVRFEPALDELFGITHSKQSVNPTSELHALLSRDLEVIAQALNARVRKSFELLKLEQPISEAEAIASSASRSLPPLPKRSRSSDPTSLDLVRGAHSAEEPASHRVWVRDVPSGAAFDVVRHRGCVHLLLNPRHPLYTEIYAPLAASEADGDKQTATRLTLLLLAIGHSEASSDAGASKHSAELRHEWSRVLASFLNA